jgi:3,5-epimerase/4-reductase
MKILLFGKNGWIGNQIYDLLIKNNKEVVIANQRAENFKELEDEIKTVNPTHIISLIGRTHGVIGEKKYTTIDYLEQPGKLQENVRDNLYSPLVLAILSQKYNIHYTYLGTGCIFKFDENHPFGKEENGFTEDDNPNFFESSYSTIKGYTDKLMHLFENNVLNIRIRMPITSDYNPRNFITKIITYNKICSVPNSMTVLPELLPIIVDMVEKNITGTINLTNPGLISHNEILEMYKEIVDPNFKWNNFSIEEQNKILAAGRSNNYLDTTRLEQLYPNVKNIKESVKDCLIKMKNNN